MLTNTFCHIPSIGEKTERNLWSAGVVSWDSPLNRKAVRLPRRLQQSWDRHIQESVENFEQRNVGYFAENLESNQQWRLYRDFQDCCAFVDIETTGLDFFCEITTITLYDGHSIRTYVNGQNLNDFVEDIEQYLLLVTYNGKQFDIPFIERYFGVRLSQAHIDLRYPLHKLGVMGGLKGCERQLGIERPGLDDVDGFLAVALWNEYRRKKHVKVLETLLAYNIQDTISLHALMIHTHNEMLKATPFFDSHTLPSSSLPAVPFVADHDTVARIRAKVYAWA